MTNVIFPLQTPIARVWAVGAYIMVATLIHSEIHRPPIIPAIAPCSTTIEMNESYSLIKSGT